MDCEEASKKLDDYQRDLCEKRDPNDEVFHYTTLVGLNGILGTSKLWLSDVSAMNDASEFRYPMELITDVLKKHPSEVARQLAPCFRSNLDTCLGLGLDWYIHVVCFSEKGDLLSQWRAYAGQQGGASIGIRIGTLFKKCNGGSYALVRITYDEEKQRGLVNATLDEADRLWREVEGQQRERFLRDVGLKTLYYAFMLKQPSFEEEREWRLIEMPKAGQSSRYRPSGGRLVPYTELDLPPCEIASIILSPGKWQQQNEMALRRWLIELGCERTAVKRSRIPLAW